MNKNIQKTQHIKKAFQHLKKNVQGVEWLKYLPMTCLAILLFLPEVNAAGQSAEQIATFKNATDKVIGWIDGGLGKMVICFSLLSSIFMGLTGFKVQQVLIPVALGLLLMSVKTISGLFF